MRVRENIVETKAWCRWWEKESKREGEILLRREQVSGVWLVRHAFREEIQVPTGRIIYNRCGIQDTHTHKNTVDYIIYIYKYKDIHTSETETHREKGYIRKRLSDIFREWIIIHENTENVTRKSTARKKNSADHGRSKQNKKKMETKKESVDLSRNDIRTRRESRTRDRFYIFSLEIETFHYLDNVRHRIDWSGYPCSFCRYTISSFFQLIFTKRVDVRTVSLIFVFTPCFADGLSRR